VILKICSISGCGKKHKGHGFCLNHLRKFNAYGDPLKRMAREKGTGTITQCGYISHQKGKRSILEHVLMVERVLGRALPKGVIVHHVDGNPAHNVNSNFVVCPNQAYHLLLHARQRALEACGNAGWMPCGRCGVYGDPANMQVTETSVWHRPCHNKYNRLRKEKAREEQRRAT
jgi:hypothetical protein